MYKKGDYVIKIPEDICEIEDVGCLDMSGVNKDKEYYALAPINQKGSKIYIPVDNVHGRIRNIISKEDAIAFIKSMPDIDEKISANAKGWKIERIAKAELAILRLAVYEALYEESVPVGVAVNEAVELAKEYGGENGAAFVNGILGKIVNE
mgnify:CR=1 FL=1